MQRRRHIHADVPLYQGGRHVAAADFNASENCCREAVRLAPDFSEAYGNLGFVIDHKGDPVQAEACCRHLALKTLLMKLDSLYVAMAYDEDIPQSGWDYLTTLMSAPYYCQTRVESIPAEIPYPHAHVHLIATWRTALLAGTYHVTAQCGNVCRSYTMAIEPGTSFDLYLRLKPHLH